MLCHSQEVVRHHTTLRWKEWIPLLSQQLRLRNLVQIIAYNINPDEKYFAHLGEQHSSELRVDTSGKIVPSRGGKTKVSFYYTLHLTTMSAPFYTSEKLENENARWSEIEVLSFMKQINSSVDGIVVRLWSHQAGEQDRVITVWGVYFSGLVYLGPRPCADPAILASNTIVFHMQGGYFTASECIKEMPKKIRMTKISLHRADIKPSYSIHSLLRLHTKQQAIKKQMLAAQDLREKISVGNFPTKTFENSTLRRLRNEYRPKVPQRQELLKARQEVESARFQVKMLHRERVRKQEVLNHLCKVKEVVIESNQDRGSELMNRYQSLHKEIEHLKEWRKTYIDKREAFLHTNAQLCFRGKQLISELSLIYPISQLEGKFYIGGIHLPNSEDFVGSEEVMISVALGFVAHLVQMVSIFLQVPLRYPIHHFSSRSKIIDHVAEKIPDKDREFPLFCKAKDKLQFNYGVYLLNKNIAQLRWLCGLPTQDLRATLPNITALLHLRRGSNGLDMSHHSLSGSSVDLRSSSQNISPVGSYQGTTFRHKPFVSPYILASSSQHFERGHRVSKSLGSTELKFPLKVADDEVQSDKFNPERVDNGPSASSLSYSLDKGLDEYEEIKRAEGLSRPVSDHTLTHGPRSGLGPGFVGSEPILTPAVHDKLQTKHIIPKINEAQNLFLQRWQACGGLGQICSDDDFELTQKPTDLSGNLSQGPNSNTVTCIGKEMKKDDSADMSERGPCQASHETDLKKSHDDNDDSNVQSHSSVDSLNLPSEFSQQQEDIVDMHKSASEESFSSAQCTSVIDETVIENQQPLALNIEAHLCNKEVEGQCNAENSDNVVCSNESEDNFGINLTSPSISLQEEEEDVLESLLNEIDEDILFASVASRTEALANRTSSFNLVRPRQGNFLEDGLL